MEPGGKHPVPGRVEALAGALTCVTSSEANQCCLKIEFGGSAPGKNMAHYRDTSPAHSCSSPGSAWEAATLKVNCHQIKSAALMLGLVASPQTLLA